MNTQVTILDRLLDPITECLTPEVARRVIELGLDSETQSRIQALREKANEGQLTDEERVQYEEIVEGLDLLGVFKAKARAALARHTS